MTPLKFTVTPDQVLARVYGSPELRMLALIGYFFSLRPQELVALRREDFVAGAAATELEAGKVMGASGLYNRLAVRVDRQRTSYNRGRTTPPKWNSKGVMACFDERAAREVVQYLNNRNGEEPGTPLFAWAPGTWARHWKRGGYPGLALKDLRRASLGWLGHYTQLTTNALRNHARHKNTSTTDLYTRRPDEALPKVSGELSLD